MTHTSTEQPEALRLATGLSGGKLIDDSTEWADTLHAAAAELCRQHARITELEDVADMAIKRIAELESQLSAIGAGGVEPLRKPVAAPLVPQGWKLVQIELLERIQESLGSFLSDQGWSQSDMDTADALGGLLAAAPQPPAAAPAQEGWCDGCSPDNCCGCGPNQEREKK